MKEVRSLSSLSSSGPFKVPFVNSSRANTDFEQFNRTLVSRYKNGLGSNQYYENDYEKFYQIKAHHESASEYCQNKLKQFDSLRKMNKESNYGKQHKLVWHKCNLKLAEHIKSMEKDLKAMMQDSLSIAHSHSKHCVVHGNPRRNSNHSNRQTGRRSISDGEAKWPNERGVQNSTRSTDSQMSAAFPANPFIELLQYSEDLWNERKEYEEDSLGAISELRSEVDVLVYERAQAVSEQGFLPVDERCELLAVKMEKLREELKLASLETETAIDSLEIEGWGEPLLVINPAQSTTPSPSKKGKVKEKCRIEPVGTSQPPNSPQVHGDDQLLVTHQGMKELALFAEETNPVISEIGGVPLDVLSMECPDWEIWRTLMTEFVLLDETFKSRLIDLDKLYQPELCCSNTGEWNGEDHTKFELATEQYDREESVPSRAQVLMDLLVRTFPDKTREELKFHQRWYSSIKTYHNKKRGILLTWKHEKDDLTLKAKATFLEVQSLVEESEQAAHRRERQRHVCAQLLDKVMAWRQKKAEISQLEAELEAFERENERQQQLIQKSRIKGMRDLQRAVVDQYKSKKQRKQQAEEEVKRLRLAELKKKMAQQALVDKERVEFRKRRMQEKELEKKELKQIKEEQEIQLEERLEALRKQVRVTADPDSARLKEGTTASKARLGVGVDPLTQYTGQVQYLPGTNTFKEEAIMSDGRLRLELALRDAGLHRSEYARQALHAIAPPREPRKDQFSTVFNFQ